MDDRIEAHLDELRAAASKLAGSADDAQDLVQETLAAALPAVGRVQHPDLIGAWLLQILRHRWYDRLRRRALERRLRPAAPDRPADPVDPDPIRRALAALDPDDRRLLEMRFFQSKDSTQIAAILRRPAGTVRSSIYYALRRFKDAYRTICGEEP